MLLPDAVGPLLRASALAGGYQEAVHHRRDHLEIHHPGREQGAEARQPLGQGQTDPQLPGRPAATDALRCGDLGGHLLPTVDRPDLPPGDLLFPQPAVIQLRPGREDPSQPRRLQPNPGSHRVDQARVIQAADRGKLGKIDIEHTYEFRTGV